MYPYFMRKFSVGMIESELGDITDGSAALRFRFTDRAAEEFGPYRRRCAYMVCQSHHGSHTAITQRVHRLPPASVRDVTCMAEGDGWCELEITWAAPVRRTFLQAAFDRLFPHRAAFRRAAAGV